MTSSIRHHPHPPQLAWRSYLEVLLEDESTAPLNGVEFPSPVEVEDGGEVVWVSVEEELRSLPGREFITKCENVPDSPRPHQPAQP